MAEDEFIGFVLGSQVELRRLAYLVCGDWHRAEDVVQTALANLYVHWSRIRRDEGAGPYARRAVVNAAIDERRRPWRRERPVQELPDGPAVREEPMDAAVVDALLSLPPRQRAVVVLRYVEDIDVAQTAHLLGISSGTVKSQAAKGLQALRKKLELPTAATRKGGAG
ncbi:MAG: SigE family RNA polymerase sigma factor [Actinobacteria bacterium]|nr:SigE family RNA polymerase sigma factor [Actinomycetota bacterium]